MTDIADYTRRNFRHNLAFNIMDSAVWQFGISFAAPTTILAVYVSHLTPNPIAVGLSLAMLDLGFFLPQLFTARFVTRLARAKPYVLTIGALQRFPYWLLALAVWAFREAPNGTMLWIYFLITAAKAFPGGLGGTAWQMMLGKVIPASWRGRHFGICFLLGGLLSLGGAAIAQQLLAHYGYPDGFALCFLFSAIGVSASWLFVAQTREPAVPPPPPGPSGRAYWQGLLDILRGDRNFTRYVVARAAGVFGWMCSSYFAVYAVQRFHVGDAEAAVFAAVLTAASLVTNPLWGYMGDRWGQKLTLLGAMALMLAGTALALVAPSLPVYYGVFVLVGAATAGVIVSDLTLVMEFGPERDRATYVGLSRTLLGPFVGVSPILAGALVGALGYPVMFATGLACTIISVALLAFTVKDPRFAGAAQAVRPAEG